MKYSVVVPVYNEERNIKALVDRIRKTMDKLPDDYEIIFVNDGSTDSSYKELKNFASSDKKIKLINFSQNYGQHPAVIAGFRSSRGAYVITLDADLQNPPEDIPLLLNAARNGYDMVSGIRSMRQDSFVRRMGSSFINLFFNFITLSNIKDYGTMLRVFKGGLAEEIARRYEDERLYIPVLVNKITRNVYELKVGHESRLAGTSKYSVFKLFNLFITIFIRYNRWLLKALQRSHIMKQDSVLYEIEEKYNF